MIAISIGFLMMLALITIILDQILNVKYLLR